MICCTEADFQSYFCEKQLYITGLVVVKHPVLTERSTSQQVASTFRNLTNNYLIYLFINKIIIDVVEESVTFIKRVLLRGF